MIGESHNVGESGIPAPQLLLAGSSAADTSGLKQLICREFPSATIHTAGDAAAAEETAANFNIDVVLLDCAASISAGLEFLARMRQSGKFPPVILLYASQEPVDSREVMRAGAFDCMPKDPIDSEVLLRSLRLAVERRRTERSLEQAEEQLRHAQRTEAIGRLAGGMAHEFKNLLHVIRGYVEFALAEVPPSEAAHDDLKQAMAAVDRASTLTQQLLGFSRREPLYQVGLGLNDIVKQAATMLRPLIEENIEVDVQFDPKASSVAIDAALIEQIFINLCVNARDAMAEGGRLSIATSLRRADKQLAADENLEVGKLYTVLSVSDTGCGMSADVRRRIFEPFFTTKDPGKGTGLGLAAVHRIVKQHRGTILVESEEGVGTRIDVLLPTARPLAELPKEEHIRRPRGGGETILLAEDEPHVRRVAQRTLKEAGYKIICAADGRQAVQQFSRHADDIDLALIDVVMPGMDGHQVMQALVNMKPEVQVIFCTGYDPKEHLHLAEGGAEYRHTILQKPYSAETLLTTVRDQLDRNKTIPPLATCQSVP